ncbi:MAG: YggT family protein [Bauldia sp.]|jgi:YggT family protein
MLELLRFINMLLQLYIYVLIASAIFSWLYAFGVVNSRNQFVAAIGQFLYVVTEPLLRPIRNFLSRLFGGNTGGIDFSPIVLILIIIFIQSVVVTNIAKLFY